VPRNVQRSKKRKSEKVFPTFSEKHFRDLGAVLLGSLYKVCFVLGM
jgi:hypothetical protein